MKCQCTGAARVMRHTRPLIKDSCRTEANKLHPYLLQSPFLRQIPLWTRVGGMLNLKIPPSLREVSRRSPASAGDADVVLLFSAWQRSVALTLLHPVRGSTVWRDRVGGLCCTSARASCLLAMRTMQTSLVFNDKTRRQLGPDATVK